jgi:hypothetical protein
VRIKKDMESIIRIISLIIGAFFAIIGGIQIITRPHIIQNYLYYPFLYFFLVLWLIGPDLIRDKKNRINFSIILGAFIGCWAYAFMIIRYSLYPISYLENEFFIWIGIFLGGAGFIVFGFKQNNKQEAIVNRSLLIMMSIIVLLWLFIINLPRLKI